jgi:mannose-6-phosphate isomerase
MVWGGRRLGDLLHKPITAGVQYGESWEVSDHPLHRSVALSGPCAGRTLRDLMEHEKAALLGPAATSHAVFPWLIKFLDANDWLSVQVHPDESAVQHLLPSEGSKTEAWFVLEAEPGSVIYAGLLPGTDERRLRAALREGTVAQCLHSFKPRSGDCVFLPAGTVHAVGGGVLMAEVQQTSDATFRLFDWNRSDAQGKRRPLHIEEAIASIHWDQGPVAPVRANAFAEGCLQVRQELVRSPYFVLEYLQGSESYILDTGRLGAVIVLDGAANLRQAQFQESAIKGQVWVLPAAMTPLQCRPQGMFKALLCTLP